MKNFRNSLIWLLLIISLFAQVVPVAATSQATNGDWWITVRESNGKYVSGAAVWLDGVADPCITDKHGKAIFANYLQPENKATTIIVTKDGYRPNIMQIGWGMNIKAGTHFDLEITIQHYPDAE